MAFVEKTCKQCNKQYQTLFKYRNKRKFCSRDCVNIYQSGLGNPAYGKTYRTKETHPKWADKIKIACAGINAGDSNGMKKNEARAKLSATRKEMLKNPDLRNKLSLQMKKAWIDGKFDDVKVGRCKWFVYMKLNGEIIKVQGTWELAFAKWADFQNLTYSTHRGRIPYILNGESHNYYPDFYVNEWNCWVDIKNDYHYSLQKNKFDALEKSGIYIKILTKNKLEEMGII